MRDILKYDICSSSPLFDGDICSKPTKSLLLKEVEGQLSSEDYIFMPSSDLKTATIVDFMSAARSSNFQSTTSFGTALKALYEKCSAVCKHNQMHIIFDSYVEHSIKGAERQRREMEGCIELAEIQTGTPIPVQIDKFWASSQNKEKLQRLAKKLYLNDLTLSDQDIVLSATIDSRDLIPSQRNRCGGVGVVQELNSACEEANLRIIPHIQWAVKKGH